MVEDSDATKDAFYGFVRSAWNLDDDPNLFITYNDNNAPKGRPYKWERDPVDRHDQSYSWEITMFWIGMSIHHNELCEHLWKSESMSPTARASILFNVWNCIPFLL